MLTTIHTQTIIITDRNNETEIGRTHIRITPDMDEIDIYRAAHVALTLWGEENGRIFNELDWHWQPAPIIQQPISGITTCCLGKPIPPNTKAG